MSDDITKYDYIKCKYKISGVTGEFSTIMSVEDFQRATSMSNCPIFGLAGYTGSAGYIRYMQYVSTTSVKFTTSYQINGTATGNLAIVPLEIFGVK